MSASVKKTVHSLSSAWKDHTAVRVSFWIVIGALFLIAIDMSHKTFSQPFHQHFENGIWVRYDLQGSKGPKYQLQFTHHNAST